MLAKIICYLFGHQRTEVFWSGKLVRMMDGQHRFAPEYWDEKVYETRNLKVCPRCGVKL